MNLILLAPDDFVSDHEVVLTGRRLAHVLSVHQATVGESLRVGELNGLMGSGEITELSTERLCMRVVLSESPPPKQPVILVLALPRPKMLKRILQMVTTLGVEHVVLINSYRVEKSYWQSPWLSEAAIHEQLLLGLEQARDTVLPKITLAKRFKPFVEDDLPDLMLGREGWLAHPIDASECPKHVVQPQLVAIGPEGGFIPYEVALLQAAGLKPVSLGARILRVETAVAVALGKLLPLI